MFASFMSMWKDSHFDSALGAEEDLQKGEVEDVKPAANICQSLVN